MRERESRSSLVANMVASLASHAGFYHLKLSKLPLHFLPFEPVSPPSQIRLKYEKLWKRHPPPLSLSHSLSLSLALSLSL